MRLLVVVVALGLLAGCVSRQQRAAEAAQEDTAWCASIGVTQGHPDYVLCRQVAAQNRARSDAVRAQQMMMFSRNATALGAGMLATPAPAPIRPPVTCHNFGNTIQCF